MRSEPDSGALREMLHNIDLAAQFAQGLDLDRPQRDTRTLYAVVRCLEIFSEASRRLSDALKARHPAIPWRDMAAAGNFYRHNYEEVTARRVWMTLRDDLPPLRAAIAAELGGE